MPASENLIAMSGIEFVEFATRNPDSFGNVLVKLGFNAVAHHRSRRVYLYRQGELNLIINADQDMPRLWPFQAVEAS
jgi:4-hydroxyphenylpyruvate dioxygenase